MFSLSDEQQLILKHIKDGYNIKVDAVAGSGKSTTVLSIAKENPDKKILQLTYNSSLRAEIKEKVKMHDLKNLTIHTYHSLAVLHYLSTSYTDTGIRYILYNNLPFSKQPPLYDIIVIDEAQDMTLVYYKLVAKFIHDNNNIHEEKEEEDNKNIHEEEQEEKNKNKNKIQLVILGDVKQGLYEFKGSDIRFLSLADKIWQNNPALKTPEFKSCTMRMSYRITNQICCFMNDVMLGENRIDACRDGEPVKYIRNSRINIEKLVVYEINRLLSNGAKPSDFFVLGGSVKGANSYIRKMENALVSQNIPCYVPMLETADKIDDRVIDGKVVFSTFHCVKGRQRPYVFIVGFDNSYFDYYARTLPKDCCPNTLYVGGTRASQGLYLLEFDQYATDRPLEFLKQTHHMMKEQPYIQFKGIPRSLFYMKEENNLKGSLLQEKHYETPTGLIKFIPESTIENISPILDRIFVKIPIIKSFLLDNENTDEIESSEIDIPSIVKTQYGYYEEVSDLNGIAIPSMYYDKFIENNNTSTNTLFSMIEENMKEIKENQHEYLKTIINELPRTCSSIKDYLYLANIYIATQERLYFKLKQIQNDEYNWLSESIVEKCGELLKNTIGKECNLSKPEIESTIIHSSIEEDHDKIDLFLGQYFPQNEKFRFTARVDMITDDSVWEIKCTSKISFDNLLQVVIYAWLWKMTHVNNEENQEKEKEFKLLNIKTGELLKLEANMDDLNFIMLAILKGKYSKNEVLTDEEFIETIIQE